jgi:hypothetical protein
MGTGKGRKTVIPDNPTRIAELLAEHGGPPDLAEQIIALAHEAQLPEQALHNWIQFHRGEWSGSGFAQWAKRYQEAARVIDSR